MNLFGGACALLLMISTAGSLSAQDCELLRDASAEQMMTYLRESSRSDADAPCLCLAIKRLGDAHVHSGIPVLIDYLGYKRPLNEGERNGIYLRGSSTPEMYPATSALFAIGKASVPYLLDVIAAPGGDQIRAQNALFTFMQIHRECISEGIKLLKTQSVSRATRGDFLESERLQKAAEEGVRYCHKNKQACENALKQSQ